MRALILIILLAFVSCQKEEERQVCADCIETTSGWVQYDAFCGTEKEVNYFIETLKKTGWQYGQYWECTKH